MCVGSLGLSYSGGPLPVGHAVPEVVCYSVMSGALAGMSRSPDLETSCKAFGPRLRSVFSVEMWCASGPAWCNRWASSGGVFDLDASYAHGDALTHSCEYFVGRCDTTCGSHLVTTVHYF